MTGGVPFLVTVKRLEDVGVRVSPEDLDLMDVAANWVVGDTGYVRGWLNGGPVYLHRMILSRMLGRLLHKGELTDHASGDKLDNRRENLRIATHAQNMANRGHIPPAGEAGFYGVAKVTGRDLWRAYIKEPGQRKQRHLGTYATPEEAARAYNTAAAELHGEFAKRNDVPDGTANPVTYALGASGVRGVRKGKNGVFHARAKLRGKDHHIGAFATAEEASVARSAWLEANR